VTTEDRELELWKQEWRAEDIGSLPQLRKRVRLQTARMIASNAIGLGFGIAVLIYAAHFVPRHPSPEAIVRSTAVLLLCLATTIFIVWNQIGIWRVETKSTLSYAELSYKRALTKVRKTRFMLIVLFCGAAFRVAYLVWADWLQLGLRPRAFFADLARVSAVLAATWLFIAWYGRRKTRQVEEARRFMEELRG
jgi:hypothetical protein